MGSNSGPGGLARDDKTGPSDAKQESGFVEAHNFEEPVHRIYIHVFGLNLLNVGMVLKCVVFSVKKFLQKYFSSAELRTL